MFSKVQHLGHTLNIFQVQCVLLICPRGELHGLLKCYHALLYAPHYLQWSACVTSVFKTSVISWTRQLITSLRGHEYIERSENVPGSDRWCMTSTSVMVRSPPLIRRI